MGLSRGRGDDNSIIYHDNGIGKSFFCFKELKAW